MKWFVWIARLLCLLAMPDFMIRCGRQFQRGNAKTIDPMYGYRTVMSMKNQDTWDYAHQVCGRVWWRTGWILLALSAVLLAWMQTRPGGEQTNWLLGILVMLGEGTALILTIIPVERALKKTFDKNGNRR